MYADGILNLTMKKNVEGYESKVYKNVAMLYLLLIINTMIMANTITITATAIIVDSGIGSICVVMGLELVVCAIGVDGVVVVGKVVAVVEVVVAGDVV
jgi:hypothetical protein